MGADLTFLDCEALGLSLRAPLWEFAAIRRRSDGHETKYHCFIKHRPHPWLKSLPDEFKVDYLSRYRATDSLHRGDALELIVEATVDAHIVGAVPNFDTERFARMMRKAGIEPSWHYHLIDVENLIVGYNFPGEADTFRAHVAAFTALTTPPWTSDDLSRAVGVNPDAYKRHTAMGDVKWVRAQYDAVMHNVDGADFPVDSCL